MTPPRSRVLSWRVDTASLLESALTEDGTVDLVRDGAGWRIRHLAIDLAWFEGDPQVLLAAV